MSRPIDILPDSSVRFPSGTTLRSVALAGTAAHWTNTESRLRGWKVPAEDDSSPQMLAAMEALDIREQETVHLDVDLTTAPDDAVIFEPVPPPPNCEQVILYQDEAGMMSWHLPDDLAPSNTPPTPTAHLRSRSSSRTFTIRTRTAGARQALRAQPASSRLRGLVTILGRKVFKVLILPIASDWLGQPLRTLAEKIEGRYRREVIRPLSAANYRQPADGEFTDWATLRGQRALLVIHGIFSTTQGMLSRLPLAAMTALQEHYEGRLIALDQLTVARGPEQNARTFLEAARAALGGNTVEFDILCHSRGGIVARTLVERGEELVPGHPCQFRKVFFAGTPNAGSHLADPDHVVEMIDAFTNLNTEFPDGLPAYTIELLLGLVKIIVHSGERHLPGAAAMSTLSDQYIAATLNAGTPAPGAPCDYAAAASDFNPASDAGLSWRLANSLVDRVFSTDRGPVPNDLVVPCDGVFQRNGHPWFPIPKRLVFEPQHGVKHTDFFAQPSVIQAIQWHFGLPNIEPPAGMVLPPGSAARLRSGKDGAGIVPPDAAPSADALLRQPHIQYHEVIEAGRTDRVVISLNELTLAQSALHALRIAAGADGSATVSVQLSAPGFDIVGQDTLPLTVYSQPGCPLESVAFTVTPRDPGPVPALKELRAVFWQGTTLLGSVRHLTAVTPPGWSGPLPDGYGSDFDTGVRFSAAPRRDCELVLSVEGDDADGVSPFRLTLRSSIPKESYESRRAGKYRSPAGNDSLEKYLAAFFDRQFSTYPSNRLSEEDFAKELPAWESNFMAEVNDLGRTLWDWLPGEFRSEYIRLYKSGAGPSSILIASEEMVLPWELVVPRDDQGNNLLPLGQAHVMGRWHPSWLRKPDPQRLRVRKACLVGPKYTGRRRLPQAEGEIAAVQRLLPGAQFNPALNVGSVRSDVLNATDLQFLHFVGHGEFAVENADESGLVLADESVLKARSFTGSSLASKASPVLYLNACCVGQTARVVGRPGGFCANFLRSGGTGVIAPYWPVNDADAVEFATLLYQKLLRNRTVGEALRELRVEHPGRSTFQAFAWLGDPWASIDLDDLRL